MSTPHLTLKYPSEDGKVCAIRADQKMACECYAAGLMVKPLVARPHENQSEVAMAELDPRTNTEDWVESLGEIQPFLLRNEGQVTMVGQSLTDVQAKEVGRVLIQNKDLFA